MENKHSVASDSSEKKKVVTLRSSDGEMFEVEKDVFMEFLTIKPMLEECSTDGDAVIPLLSITGQTLAKVIEFCKKHIDHEKLKSDDPFFFSPEAADKEIKALDKKNHQC
ncbi:hypothetical protein Pfo_008068 [Paulownia fortunei]|nr:hypothetical protein Pfo_008068 [Paulownia fortunei]